MRAINLSEYRLIDPESVTRFLSDRGWSELNIKPGIVALWGVEAKGESHKVLIPLNPDFPDYPNRMIDAIEVISAVESIEEFDLLGEIRRII